MVHSQSFPLNSFIIVIYDTQPILISHYWHSHSAIKCYKIVEYFDKSEVSVTKKHQNCIRCREKETQNTSCICAGRQQSSPQNVRREYSQEISQSHTAEQPTHGTTRKTQRTLIAKQQTLSSRAYRICKYMYKYCRANQEWQ